MGPGTADPARHGERDGGGMGRWRTVRGGRRAVAGAGLCAAVLVAGCDADVGLSDGSPSPGSGPAANGTVKPAQARRDLDGLRVASEGAGRGYERDRFGTRWKDIDRNGCDQRNDVLARDLREVRKRGGCVVIAGTLDDPYSGKRITFSKSDAAEVQIDHVYPLALAWRMGASGWDEDRRERFANDPDNLLAVWGVPNRQKSDSGPGEWKPQRAFQCAYAARYIAVAKKYSLPVTGADRGALGDFLGRC
ncbi:HNH endonuclease family protein [Actinomadura viridis]|uniref:HNH endonuclease family protein n=1 Tax=Actinomadura viridis TaxID=58110 RepID=UPI0036CAC822